MTLVKYARPRISRSFDSMFDNLFEDFNRSNVYSNVWRPAMDVQEHEKSYDLSFSLPGFDREEITVSVKNNTLTLKAARSDEKKKEDSQYLTREIARGSYERNIDLPENVNSDKIAAEYKNGILLLSIPKTKEALPKEIAVTVK